MRFSSRVNGARLSVIGLGTWQFGFEGVGLRPGVRADRSEPHPGSGRSISASTFRRHGRGSTGRGRVRSASSAAPSAGPPPNDAFLGEQGAADPADGGLRSSGNGRGSAARLGRRQPIDLYQIPLAEPGCSRWAQQMEGMRRLQQAGGIVGRVGGQQLLAREVGTPRSRRWARARCFSNQVSVQPGSRGNPTPSSFRTRSANDRLVIAYSPLGIWACSRGATDAEHLARTGLRAASNNSLFPAREPRTRTPR